MITELTLTALILGACFGSFLNVVAHRSIQGKSWWGSERSVCESCGHVLGVIELIPIVSWLIQRGKCRKCGAKISVRYILVEIICALMAVTIALKWGISWAGLICAAGSCGLVVNSLTDYESGDVFDLFALTPGVLCLIIRIAGGKWAVIDGLAGALAGWGIFAAIIILSRGGMGWGDAVFMTGVGGVLGLKFTLFAFYAGIMTGGIYVIILMLIGRLHWGKGETIALVPFLSVGIFLTMIYGVEIFGYLGNRMMFHEMFAVTWPFTAVN
ncbi:MAG: prepilin peptidase [Synergistaceae bacterium]|nr:prepilin peptidase [Synergistaceae bacterium]